MQVNDVLSAAFENIRQVTQRTMENLNAEALTWQPDPESNTIAWLLWHLARIQDDHIADIAGTDQVWVGDRWAERFGLEPGTMDHGYGHSPEQVAAIRPADPSVLTDYVDQATDQTLAYLESVDVDELDRVVDTSWDPPVTAGVRLNSVISDNLQHLGQAAYVRGLYERR